MASSHYLPAHNCNLYLQPDSPMKFRSMYLTFYLTFPFEHIIGISSLPCSNPTPNFPQAYTPASPSWAMGSPSFQLFRPQTLNSSSFSLPFHYYSRSFCYRTFVLVILCSKCFPSNYLQDSLPHFFWICAQNSLLEKPFLTTQ